MALLDDEELLPFFGNPNIQRQGARARALAAQRDVNTLPDPRTYAALSGLLGTAPDQMGFSVLNPQYESIMKTARPAFATGTALGVAPVVGLAGKVGAKVLGPTAARMTEGYLQQQGLMPSITAYHAGPNLFNRFDVSRAPATGSAYTQGAYAAASRREAQGKYLPRTGPAYEEKVMGLYKAAEKNRDYESMEVLESAMLSQLPSEMRQNFIKSGEYSPAFAKKAEGIINKLEKLPRDSYLYKLDIADEALPNYMLFDKPISQQPAAVQSFAKELGIAGDDMLGGDIVGKLRASGVKEAQIQEMMRKKGIPGLIYDSPDVPGSVNYVTYDPDLIKILEVNDMPASGFFNTLAP
jgi:hypothetical protein